MPNDNLFIADRIKVGFQEREDTYTKKLGYVIYYDKKGVLRKERSWEGWRDKKIEHVEHDNVPTEGFVLNRNGGGTRHSYGWNTRAEFVRVWDPRDFEFEISIGNLLYILTECDCSRGKGLEGRFVYAWDKTNLVLLPVGSAAYRECVRFTELQDKKVKAKELVAGHSYKTRDNRTLTYLGRFDKFMLQDGYREKKHWRPYVFWTGERYEFHKNTGLIALLHSDVAPDNFADLVDGYVKGPNGSRVVALELRKSKKTPKAGDYNRWWIEDTPGEFSQFYGRGLKPDSVELEYRHSVGRDGDVPALRIRHDGRRLYSTAYCEKYNAETQAGDPYYRRYRPILFPSKIADDGPLRTQLYAVLESGSAFPIVHANLEGAS